MSFRKNSTLGWFLQEDPSPSRLDQIGLAYVVGDFIGTKIYENLPEDTNEAMGKIIYDAVEGLKRKAGIEKSTPSGLQQNQ